MKARPSRVLRPGRERQFPTVFRVNLSDPRVIEAAARSPHA